MVIPTPPVPVKVAPIQATSVKVSDGGDYANPGGHVGPSSCRLLPSTHARPGSDIDDRSLPPDRRSIRLAHGHPCNIEDLIFRFGRFLVIYDVLTCHDNTGYFHLMPVEFL